MVEQNKSPHLIELVNITKTYWQDDPENWIEAVHALRWINFWIDEWAFISIMWPSWCWKSTLMNIVWLLDEPTSWDYLLRWEKVEAMTADEKLYALAHELGHILCGTWRIMAIVFLQISWKFPIFV